MMLHEMKEEEYNEKHGIPRQKDLSKFYSHLLKYNILMGAHNVKAGDNITNKDSNKETTPRTDQPRDEDAWKEKKLDDDDIVEQKRYHTRRPHDEGCHEERNHTGTEK